VAPPEIVENRYFVTELDQSLGGKPADIAGAAGYHDTHEFPFVLARLTACQLLPHWETVNPGMLHYRSFAIRDVSPARGVQLRC
jgi:hypothetical protein